MIYNLRDWVADQERKRVEHEAWVRSFRERSRQRDAKWEAEAATGRGVGRLSLVSGSLVLAAIAVAVVVLQRCA